jgi:hypothetical protein
MPGLRKLTIFDTRKTHTPRYSTNHSAKHGAMEKNTHPRYYLIVFNKSWMEVFLGDEHPVAAKFRPLGAVETQNLYD